MYKNSVAMGRPLPACSAHIGEARARRAAFKTAFVGARGRRSLSVATGVVAAAALTLASSGHAAAASGTQVVTGTTQGGVLSITAPGALALPTLVGGTSTAATNLGSLSWTDTMNDAAVSSVTLAATTDFATYSTPITLATASATSEGTWTEAANQITVAVPANTTPGTSFAATIQYTVTG